MNDEDELVVLYEDIRAILGSTHNNLKAIAQSGNLNPTEDFQGAQLRGLDLSKEDLTGFNFTRADLQGADLYQANLSGVSMIEANLANAKLVEVNMQYTNLTRANLYGADLRGADLRNANLRFSDLTHVELSNVNWLGADTTGAKLPCNARPNSVVNDRKIEMDSFQRKRKAYKIIHTAAAASAATAGALAKGATFGADTAILTPITIYMVIALGNLFNQQLSKSMAIALLGQAPGAGMRIAAAKGILGIFPDIGNLVNASITFTYTEALGWWVYDHFNKCLREDAQGNAFPEQS